MEAKKTDTQAIVGEYYRECNAQEPPKTPLAMEIAEISFKAGRDEEYRKWVKAFMGAGILIAEADTVNIAIKETKRAGIREVVDYFSRHWMGATKGMLIYEIPDKDRDLLEDGIVPN